MTSIFYITKHATGFYPQSTEVLRDQFGGLGEGQYKVTVEDAKEGRYTGTRYKYYFGHVLPAILEKCAKSFTAHRRRNEPAKYYRPARMFENDV